MPRMVTRKSSNGNTVPNAEWARLDTKDPALSSPNFLMTPNTNAVGVWRCCRASRRRKVRSTGFTVGAYGLLSWLINCSDRAAAATSEG